MARESLGTVRLHRWTCDQCGKQIEHRSRASGTIPRPPGWGRVSVTVEEIGSEANRTREGDVCSAECAGEFVQAAVNPPQAVDPTTDGEAG